MTRFDSRGPGLVNERLKTVTIKSVTVTLLVKYKYCPILSKRVLFILF